MHYKRSIYRIFSPDRRENPALLRDSSNKAFYDKKQIKNKKINP
jgi:hypothetical protein